MVYGPASNGLPSSTASFAPAGSAFGAGLHETEVRYLIETEFARRHLQFSRACNLIDGFCEGGVNRTVCRMHRHKHSSPEHDSRNG